MQEQKLPPQHYFVSNRTFVVGSTLGASIGFERGKPVHVPKFMHAIVMEKGCIPCTKEGKPLDAEEAPAQEEARVLIAPETAEERNDAILKVCKEVLARNKSSEFTAGGTPSAAAVSLALGWRVDQKEVRDVWVKNRKDLIEGAKDE